MHEFDEAALERRLRSVLGEHLGSLPLDITVEDLERRREVRDAARRRHRGLVVLGLAAALLVPLGVLVGGGRPLLEAVMVPDASASPAATATPEAFPPGAWVTRQPDNMSFNVPGVHTTWRLESGPGARVRLPQQAIRPAFESTVTVVADHQVRLVITSVTPLIQGLESGTPVAIDGLRLAGCKLGDVGLYTWSISADGALLTLASDGDACPSREAVLARAWSLPAPRAARVCSTATLLPDGRVLVAGGSIVPRAVASADLYDPKTGTFSPTGSMTAARECSHTATLLPDGRVLVAGAGWSDSGAVASADLYDPKTGTFSPTASMTAAVSSPTATLLTDGRVLVAGGVSIDGAVASADLYDPKTGTFSTTGSLAPPRTDHTATLLPDGRVLVAGGKGGSADGNDPPALASADLYDPKTGTFSTTGSLATPRIAHTATLLPDGRVLVVGGSVGVSDDSETFATTAEIYDPKTGTFSTTGSLATPRIAHTATLLPDGRVLVAGGANASEAFATAEIYDPATGTFSPTGSMTAARRSHTATLLPDGRVLVAGGSDEYGLVAPAEIYDPKTGTFSPTGP